MQCYRAAISGFAPLHKAILFQAVDQSHGAGM